jgi:hypothetical protein
MLQFMEHRGIRYLVADPYFREAVTPWIPASAWPGVFDIQMRTNSRYYGAPSGGGSPPYDIEVWRMKATRSGLPDVGKEEGR